MLPMVRLTWGMATIMIILIVVRWAWGLDMVTAMDEEKEYYWNVGTIAQTRT